MLIVPTVAIDALLDEHIVRAGVAPGACAAVSTRTMEGWCTLMGASGTVSDQSHVGVSTGTWFDLASVTKSLFAFALGRHVDRGLLGWSDPLSEHAPWARGTFCAHTPLEQLVAHRSGLAAHVDLAAPRRTSMPWQREEQLVLAANSANPARRSLDGGGFEAVYSDLGYVLSGEALSLLTKLELDEVLQGELLASGITGFGSARQLELARSSEVAATEDTPWRGGRLRGIVHDDNAFALTADGTSGHAGMFGNITGVMQFATRMLDEQRSPGRYLSAETCQVLLQERPGGTERVGFDGKNPTRSSLGDALGGRAFGHFGFTGTGFWCDPEQQIAVALLTNRVCPSRDNLRIRLARPIVHDQLVALGVGQRRHGSR
jgi:serine-type D-Ala-D-Ala carboxypeptidase